MLNVLNQVVTRAPDTQNFLSLFGCKSLPMHQPIVVYLKTIEFSEGLSNLQLKIKFLRCSTSDGIKEKLSNKSTF